ncbi:type II secretion system protein [Noviherbaspirillum massiliense]|uniref:type II secretion system protein n=1 Tax=Noviherbaspirillum massiliense TaxID=1465823 RepID=UPI001FDEDDC0|nr:prepilin-type N-terminal cleavage/methylation domain-containing protein [Noviherbaspirillum massiliense]
MKRMDNRVKAGAAAKRGSFGFTLIELLVVMAILALLLTLATPRYFNNVEKSKEAVLRQNLASMRDAIDKYYGDNGKYPETLEDLVTKKYLRRVALDPITDSATTWLIVPPEQAEKGGVYDIRSGAPGKARDGSAYKDW